MSEEHRGLSRRELLKRGGVGAAAVGALGAAAGPAAASRSASGKYTGTLRVIGLGVDLIDPIRKQAEKDLGFKLVFTVTDSVTMVQKAITQPDSFDVFSGYHYQYDQIWPTGNFQVLDTQKVPRWNQVSPLFKLGKVRPGNKACTYGQGDAPARSQYVNMGGPGPYHVSPDKPPAVAKAKDPIVEWLDEASGRGKGAEPRYVNSIPHNFNMDSMGYNGDVIKVAPDKMSWGQLLNKQWAGRVAILNDPGIGMQDLANAVEALGMYKFKNKGDMTKKEIDALVKIASKYKSQKHFRAFWTTFNESVNFMSSKEVVIESMWSPAVALLAAQQFPIRYAAPLEGFRGWTGSHAFSSKLTDPAKLQAAYDYANWWHSGWPGAVMMRQGYYNAVQGTSKKFADAGEYAYWIEGKPADKDYPGPFGDVSIHKGQVRDGGSFVKRACKYASWNSYFRESQYQVKRWNDFLS